MCGILGVFGDLNKESDQYNRMLSLMEHRGPDDIGVKRGSQYFLGHQRLSIIDVESGHQPIQSMDKDKFLICNGEVYNHNSLKKRVGENYDFNTNSDSEVIIPVYEQDGLQSANNIEGMFSFILLSKDSYFVARDPIGIKPLYWGSDDNCLFFSSEIKSLINYTENIEEFPNGHYYSSTKGLQPYYQLPKTDSFITDIDLAVKNIRDSLKSSVKKRLMSDVEVGVFLSGGLDSSIIASLMKEEIPKLHSFSVGLQDSPDLKAARLVSEYLGTTHHEYIYTEEEMFNVLPDVIYYLESFDSSLVRSAIPCYFVSRLASDYVKVILSGEGADELFAGYSYLANYEDPKALHSESLRIIEGLHNLNLQRVDRMTMAHCIEGRVPFLDLDFIKTVLSISPELKLHSTFGIEKWLLRKAFEDKLPQEIVWRNKAEFAQGCGSSTVLEKATLNYDNEEILKNSEGGNSISSKEELFFFSIFKNRFNHPDAEKLIGRWNGTLH